MARGSAKSSRLSDEVIAQRLDLITRPGFDAQVYRSSPLPKGGSGPKIKAVGILTSGGDGPAENAAIAALVEEGEGHGWRILGIRDGFKGLLDPEPRIRELSLHDVHGPQALKNAREVLYLTKQLSGGNGLKGIQDLGGNLLKSSRTDPIERDAKGNPHAETVKKTMRDYGIDVLVILGGNGTLRACRDLIELQVPLVFIPQSIDADVPGSVTAIGYPSAVNRGASELAAFLNTAQSCGRWFLVEVMGQSYGLLTLGIAFNATQGRYYDYGKHQGMPLRVDTVFTEIPREMQEISQLVQRRKGFGQDHGIILISEGVNFVGAAPPREVNAYQRMLIEAGDVCRWVRQRLLTRHDLRNTRSVSLGYSLRGAGSSVHDIALAQTFAKGALDLIAQGSLGRMVGMEFVGNSAKWTMAYPKVEQMAPKTVSLNPDYFNFVKRFLEERKI
jgi:ATP-dependent phosphofructokinase / diphosphate-dependent phosphofructokinase